MLLILMVVGIFGTIMSFLFTIIALFKLNWRYVLEYGIKMVVFIVFGLIGLSGIFRINSLSYEYTTQTGDWELVSIKDNSQKRFDGLEFSSFYYKVNGDEIKREIAKTDSITIYEKDGGIPHIVEYTTYTRNRMNKVLRAILAFGYGESNQKSYKIYIPEEKLFLLNAQ